MIRPTVSLAALCALAVAATSPVRGAINQDVIFRVGYFSQTSSAAPSSADGYYFTARIFMDNDADFDGGTLDYPGPGSPAVYSLIATPSPAYLNYGSSSYPDQVSLDADFPAGTYTTTATNSSTSASQTTALNYSGVDAYPQTIPALDAASYNALQGANPAMDQAADFNSDVPDPTANEQHIFFTIYDLSGNPVFDDGFAPSSITSITIPANTLSPNTPYTYTLIFSDRIDSTNPADNVFDQLGYDYGTSGNFTTGAVPEPAAGLILLALPALRRRKRCD